MAVAVRSDDVAGLEVEQGRAVSQAARLASLVEEADEALLWVVVKGRSGGADPRPGHGRHQLRRVDLAGQPFYLERPLAAGDPPLGEAFGKVLLRLQPAPHPPLGGRRRRPRLPGERDQGERGEEREQRLPAARQFGSDHRATPFAPRCLSATASAQTRIARGSLYFSSCSAGPGPG